MRKAYLDGTNGQIHARYWHERKDGTPLLCLPPAPHTGLYYQTLADHLSVPMIAVDYPGAGSSCPLPHKPSISDYASVIGSLLPKIGRVNLLGFHSGCLVALELTRSYGSLCDKVICIDFPLFDSETRTKYASYTTDVEPPKVPNDLEKSFNTNVTNRRDIIGEPRALELWVESLRAGPRYNDTFKAAFAYEADKALEESEKDINFFGTQCNLLEPTREAAKLCKNGRFTEVLEIEGNALETGAPILAPLITDALL